MVIFRVRHTGQSWGSDFRVSSQSQDSELGVRSRESELGVRGQSQSMVRVNDQSQWSESMVRVMVRFNDQSQGSESMVTVKGQSKVLEF